MTALIQCLDLGLTDYRRAYSIQEKIHRGCCLGEFEDTIILQENDPVVTVGKSGSEDNLLLTKDSLAQKGIKLEYVDRGGDITYHGPGQLVISPVLHLKRYIRSVHGYVRGLEQAVINLLENYDIQGRRIEGASGVWVGEEKIAAIGIAVKRGITLHGIAINVRPDLEHFKYIIPCGIRDKGVTSFERLGISDAGIKEIGDAFTGEFDKLFNTLTTRIKIKDLRCLEDEI